MKTLTLLLAALANQRWHGTRSRRGIRHDEAGDCPDAHHTRDLTGMASGQAI